MQTSPSDVNVSKQDKNMNRVASGKTRENLRVTEAEINKFTYILRIESEKEAYSLHLFAADRMVSIDSLNYATQQIYIYGYCFIFLTGMIGNTINILMFSTNLRKSPCSLYLLSTEVCDCLEILVWIVPYTVQVMAGVNGTESNLGWCKLMPYLAVAFTMMSMAILCLASIDRYHSTCRNVRQRQWSSMKVAKITILLAILGSLIISIPNLIYYYIENRGHISYCTENSDIYNNYFNYFVIPVLWCFAPFGILFTFGFLTHRNLKHAQTTATATSDRNGTVQKTEMERIEDQLSRMLILQIICFSISTGTWSAVQFYFVITVHWQKSDFTYAVENLIISIAAVIYLHYTSSSFYVYYFSSHTYRKRVKQMIGKILGLRGRMGVEPAAAGSSATPMHPTKTTRA